MKETAVEWLEKIRQAQKEQPFDDYEWKIAFNYAKEMEKQQIVEAHENKLKQSRDTGNYEYWFSGKDYYNKTFKNTEQ